MRGTEDPPNDLCDEYSQHIDSALVLAILHDYDLTDPGQYAAARHILDDIRATVADEEVGFDPSGAGGDHGSAVGENESSSARSGPAWKSQTDDTSQSQENLALEFEGLDLSENASTGVLNQEEQANHSYTSKLDALDPKAQEAALVGIFPSLKPFDVRWTLRKFKGDTGKSIDDLMTQAFLEESGTRSRGIDAFSELDANMRPRKTKGKKRKNTRIDEPESSNSTTSMVSSKWDIGKRDVEFISEKTGMPSKQVQSLYNTNGGSLPKTISAIIEAHIAIGFGSEDPMHQINVSELGKDYPSISTPQLEALLQITHPSITNANELAKALTSVAASTASPIHLEFRHAPLDLSDHLPSKPHTHNAIDPSRPLDASTASAIAATYTTARNRDFNQAASAYRKSKSDPLFGGAAAFYADRGHENHVRAKLAERDLADARVAAQSSKTQLDLHGVDVQNAVRITREGVTRWWHELGEAKHGSRDGYKIITGVGRHSADGRAKLGPAIFRMLNGGGWKFEVWEGHFVVTGVRKK